MAILHNSEIKKGAGKVKYMIIISILLIGIPVQIAPYMWMVFNSFKSPLEIIQLPPTLWPADFFSKGFAETFHKFHLLQNFWNTFYLAMGVLMIQVVTSALAAYSLSKLRPKYGKLILLFFIGTMMINGQALLFPLYIIMANLGMIDNNWSYILSCSAWGYVVFLFKGFFDGLPNELLEAAKIDGSSSFRTFVSIVIPLSKPVLAVNILNTFMATYNDFLLPTMLLPSENNWTVMMRVYFAEQAENVSKNNMFVMLTVATIPVVLVYLLAQKQISQGIALTGIKG